MTREETMFMRSKCCMERWKLVLTPDKTIHVACFLCGKGPGNFNVVYLDIKKAFNPEPCPCGCDNKLLKCKKCDGKVFDIVLEVDDRVFLQCMKCETRPEEVVLMPYGKSADILHDTDKCECCECEKKRGKAK